ncbi:MAG: response regulator [Magnetococcus sp. DMHC-8]
MTEQELPVVLIVDDTETNIDILVDILADQYDVMVAMDGDSAIEMAANRPDLILLDVMMPEMDGYEVCRRLKASQETRDIPVIFVTARTEVADEIRGFDLGAVDYITKPISPPVVKARVRTHIRLKQSTDALAQQNRILEEKVQQRTAMLQATRLEIIHKLGRAAEFKDNETGLHVVRMSHYAKILGMGAGLGATEAQTLFDAAPMHDIGKIGIPDNILLKPGRLTDTEFAIIRQHPQMGADIIGSHESELLQMACLIAYTHHEKWDGTGYPRGLAGEAIPLVGRIVAIADVFDALVSDRPYKAAWTIDAAVALVGQEAGKHFDPRLVAIFNTVLPELLTIKQRFEESSRPA